MILDLGLPTVCGTEVLRRLRAAGPVPIIVLTALGTESDRVLGLELGADDYVTKPFSMAELMSRVRAIVRRCELEAARSQPVRIVGGLRIDLGRHQVVVDGRSVYLTASQFKLLALLAEHPGDVVSRNEIMHRLWDSTSSATSTCATSTSRTSATRSSGTRRIPQRVVTIRGVGYKLVPA